MLIGAHVSAAGGSNKAVARAEEIGADGFAPDASAAVDVAGNLVKWR